MSDQLTEEECNKGLVRRANKDVINGDRLDLVDELYAAGVARAVKAWIAPVRASFPDVRMEVIDLVAEGSEVVGRFVCSGPHAGEWRGHPPTGVALRGGG